jgi:hypothetical protein
LEARQRIVLVSKFSLGAERRRALVVPDQECEIVEKIEIINPRYVESSSEAAVDLPQFQHLKLKTFKSVSIDKSKLAVQATAETQGQGMGVSREALSLRWLLLLFALTTETSWLLIDIRWDLQVGSRGRFAFCTDHSVS